VPHVSYCFTSTIYNLPSVISGVWLQNGGKSLCFRKTHRLVSVLQLSPVCQTTALVSVFYETQRLAQTGSGQTQEISEKKTTNEQGGEGEAYHTREVGDGVARCVGVDLVE
jgi:hypothetical protein